MDVAGTYEGMVYGAEERSLQSGNGSAYSSLGQKMPGGPASGEGSTHRVDDALQSLEAVIHGKHVILAVRDPRQLRTQQTQRHTRGIRLGRGELRKATGSGGIHLLLDPKRTGFRGLTKEPSATMSLPVASLEQAQGRLQLPHLF